MNQAATKQTADLSEFSWYPGHIAKAEKELKEKIKSIDVVVELRDARVPFSSAHKDLYEWCGDKPVITALTKIDIADPKRVKYFKNHSEFLLLFSKDIFTIRELLSIVEKACEPVLQSFAEKGAKGRPIRVMIVGLPNVGKSSIINSIVKTKKTQVENRPGVTMEQQWVDVKSKIDMKLLDTPGIIPMKFYSKDQALKLALCGLVADSAFDVVEIARAGIELIRKLYPGVLEETYNDPEPSPESIAEKFNWVRKDVPDLNQASRKFLKDFREGRFGKLSLE